MIMKFAVGRWIDGTADAYDLEGCPLFDRLKDAVDDLVTRCSESPEIAPDLQVLQCRVDRSGNVHSYTPVRSGGIMHYLTTK